MFISIDGILVFDLKIGRSTSDKFGIVKKKKSYNFKTCLNESTDTYINDYWMWKKEKWMVSLKTKTYSEIWSWEQHKKYK